ncbi:MAG: hypothetical protein FD168_530 [Desulfobulbaceae bacterium]|nr:MAG: hypothetical protein FD168_530 [Desulfobulbaceae bacterium]
MRPLLMNPSPFVSVCLDRCQDYDRSSLKPLLAKLMPNLGELHLSPGAQVLLKPNLIAASVPALACTHAGFIAAVAEWFLDHGCRVVVGDSPAFGRAITVAEHHGIALALRGMNVPIIEFTSVCRRQLPCGITVGIAAEALEFDLLVNLPKIKAHDQMYVTMAVKNIFGIVKGMRKSWLHMRYGDSPDLFSRIILELSSVLPNTVTIADGIEVMHRQGPVHGEPLLLGCVACSRSAVALDTAMLALLELDPGLSPMWRAAGQRNLPGTQLSGIDFPFLVPSDFFGSGFVAPEVLTPIRFRPFRYVVNSMKRAVLALHRG